jgi:hypothetical protein
MAALARRVRMAAPTLGTVALLAAAALAGCGGSGSGRSGGTASRSTTHSTTTTSPTSPPPSEPTGPLSLSPPAPTTSSELTFRFTAPVASGVHDKHVINYTLSLLGPGGAGCVGAHEAGVPAVASGAQTKITLGPAELHAPWCAGRYLARVIELRRAHCTSSVPCPQYVAVVGVVARRRFTIRRG